MADQHAPTLSETSDVDLDLGGANGLVRCRILAFLGPLVLATHSGALDESVQERLAAGADGYLLVGDRGNVRALRTAARHAGENTVSLEIKDPFRLGQRRGWTRVEVALDARLEPLGIPGQPLETRTIDVSPGGLRVEHPEGTPVRPRYELTLQGLPPGTPMVAEVAAVRRLPGALALRFTRLEPDDLQRLIALVLGSVTS